MTSNVFLPYILFDVLSIIIATVLVGLQYKKLQYTSTLSSTDLARAKELALLFYIHFPFFANLENDVQRKAVSKNIYLHRTNQQPMIRAHEKQRRIHSEPWFLPDHLPLGEFKKSFGKNKIARPHFSRG